MKNKISKVLNVISIIILILAVTILLSSVFTKDGGIPEVGGYSFMRVLTGSMEPEIKTDSVIIVERMDGDKSAKQKSLKVGDIISFYSSDGETSGQPMTHRIVEIDRSSGEPVYTTKGDANALADQNPCYGQSVIGRVCWYSHFFGVIVSLLLNPVVFFPLIIFPIVLLILINLRDAIKRGKELAREEEEAAVREALEIIKQRKEAENNEIEEKKEE